MSDPTLVRLASYNVHGCVGRDGLHAPERIADVLREIDADVIALQEVATPKVDDAPVRQIERLAELLDMHWALCATRPCQAGDFGNGLLTRFPVRSELRVDLRVPGREPRFALEATVDARGTLLRIIVVHLGLFALERHVQALRLSVRVQAIPGPLVVLGDLNEWMPFLGALRWLDRHIGPSPHLLTFPAGWPLLALDRIWARPARSLVSATVHASPLARVASDHLPIRAVLSL